MEIFQLGFFLLLATLCVGVTNTTTRLQFDRNQHENQGGHCPHDFERYNPNDDPGCPGECRGDQDCSNGEMCCVENRDRIHHRSSIGSNCPVCSPPVYGVGCYYDTYYGEYEYYQDDAIFSPEFGGCAICQCLNGNINCYNTCDNPFALREWIVPGITMGVALLVVLFASLSVCCCVKCCRKTRERTVHYGAGMQVQRPHNFHTSQHTARAEDKAPLTNYDMA
ncbi:uncharacterized protein LOC119742194 [Patiria miniata]|uniref:Uncharacterized protein n=1 Tax=Patiria miniata TaxID=46514 RepID=A0A914BD07_PATMI|nr:uncharacterized protein LOC119742150 [Patiria miniata]XP_038074161.1 uncharacterized protein LOC119742194 [Patiria miniata]